MGEMIEAPRTTAIYRQELLPNGRPPAATDPVPGTPPGAA